MLKFSCVLGVRILLSVVCSVRTMPKFDCSRSTHGTPCTRRQVGSDMFFIGSVLAYFLCKVSTVVEAVSYVVKAEAVLVSG